jgi:hypothetical protein
MNSLLGCNDSMLLAGHEYEAIIIRVVSTVREN